MSEDEAKRKRLLDKISQADERRRAARGAGVPALQRLLNVALGDTGQSRACGRFLLGLYNGPVFRFELTDLRLLDAELHDDCLAVLRMDHSPEREVHQYFTEGDALWARLKEQWMTPEEVARWQPEAQR
jgi:hypothetical protein